MKVQHVFRFSTFKYHRQLSAGESNVIWKSLSNPIELTCEMFAMRPIASNAKVPVSIYLSYFIFLFLLRFPWARLPLVCGYGVCYTASPYSRQMCCALENTFSHSVVFYTVLDSSKPYTICSFVLRAFIFGHFTVLSWKFCDGFTWWFKITFPNCIWLHCTFYVSFYLLVMRSNSNPNHFISFHASEEV